MTFKGLPSCYMFIYNEKIEGDMQGKWISDFDLVYIGWMFCVGGGGIGVEFG